MTALRSPLRSPLQSATRSPFQAQVEIRSPVTTTYTDYVVLPANWQFIAASYSTGTRLLTESSGSNFHLASPIKNITSAANTRGVLIAELKAGARSWANLNLGGFAYFNLSTGAVATETNTFVAAMKDLGDGWWECVLAPFVNPANGWVAIATGAATNIYTGDGVSGIYVRNVRQALFRNGRIKVNPSPSSSASSVTISPTPKYRGGLLIGDSFAAASAMDLTRRVNSTSNNIILIPLGVGGNTLALVNLTFTSTVSFYDPTFAVLQAGVNTIGAAGSDPLAGMQSEVAAFVASCNAVGILPVLTLLPPFSGATYWTSTRQTYWAAYNAWLPGYAASIGAPLLDLVTILSDDGTTPRASTNSGDNLHPNAAGYSAIGDALVTLLDNVLA